MKYYFHPNSNDQLCQGDLCACVAPDNTQFLLLGLISEPQIEIVMIIVLLSK